MSIQSRKQKYSPFKLRKIEKQLPIALHTQNVRLPPKGEGKVTGTEWRHYKHSIHQNKPNLKNILALVVQNRIKEAKIHFLGKTP